MTEINSTKSNNVILSYGKKIILLFFIYAFIGWCIETFYCFYELGTFEKRGFLFGPICPIYGFGAVILIMFLRKFKHNKFLLFIISGIVFTIFEYLTSFGIEAILGESFWDYSTEFANLNGRVTLLFSIIWGLFGIIFITYVNPIIEKFIRFITKHIHESILSIIANTLCVIYVLDTVLSFIRCLIN